MQNYEFGKDKFEEEWSSTYSPVPIKEVDESWEKFRSRLRFHKNRGNGRVYKKIGLVAAMLLMLFGSYFFLEIYSSTITVENISQVDKQITLPDGSLVLLKKGSEVQYKENFEKARDLKLKGEAFFNVVKDNSKKFKVSTVSTTTTVLGTSFSVVEKEESDDVEIFLYTGKVLISGKCKSGSWALVPGESLKYSQGKGQIKNFDTNLSFESGNKYIDVGNLQLEKLLYFLEQRFGYKFQMNSYTKNKVVTLRINKQDSLEQILKILTVINNTTYEINEDKKEVQIFSK